MIQSKINQFKTYVSDKYNAITIKQWETTRIFSIGFLSGVLFFILFSTIIGFFQRRNYINYVNYGHLNNGNINRGESMGDPMEGGPMGPGRGPGKMFDNFCKDGKMFSGDKFIERFKRGAEERFQKANLIRKDIDNIITKAKRGKDTTNLENKIKEIGEMMSRFAGGKEEFLNNPQNFCDKKPEWETINTQIKKKMMEVGQEIDSLR